jgi:primosomal protein N'
VQTSAHLETLNSEQQRAVEHGTTDGLAAAPLLVIAGAGSGKTNTLAHRVAHLIVQGPDPRRILLMTSCQSQSTTATASISISHSGAASAETPTSVLAGGVMPSKKAERAWPMMGRSSGL